MMGERILSNLRCQAALCDRIAAFVRGPDMADEWRRVGAEIDELVRAHMPADAAAPAARALN
jgi:hypothetical protein